MGSKNVFTVVNAILLISQITNISAQGLQPQPMGRLLTPEEGCGISKVANTKIVGGSTVRPGEYPWLALLLYTNPTLDEFYPNGGGTLITSRHVLTAAHCISPSLVFVRLGEHDLISKDDGVAQDYLMSRILMHPQHNEDFEGSYDIAVITLERDVTFTDRIRPICMPLTAELQWRNFVGSSAFIAGWGLLKENGTASNLPMHVQVPVLNNVQCKNVYRNEMRLMSEKEFGNNVLCAGYLEGGKDACQGDSGGPLMLPIFNGTFHMYQIGIISYGSGCAQKNAPGVYSSVQHYMGLIQKMINTK